jgi:hypothetical protein
MILRNWAPATSIPADHRQADVVEAAGPQLTQRGPGPFDEHLRHRGLARRGAVVLHGAADRLTDPGEPPGQGEISGGLSSYCGGFSDPRHGLNVQIS